VVVEALEPSANMTEPYCFGRFTLDPAERRLCADGALVPLGPTDFCVLLALVERAGAIVTKSELVSRVWGSSAVTDNVLYFHISVLRKALGEGCIQNEQRRGYRFVAPVRRTEPLAPHPRVGPRAGNLPPLWTSNAVEGPTRLIGRSEQLRTISNLLAQGRVVTLTGPGGVGKTRLALQAASKASPQFCDGVWLVELASLKDPDLVPVSIASVLGVKIGASADPLDTLQRYLARKSLLLVLDNCEHMLSACAPIAETFLTAAPEVNILATSREALSCFGERVLEVPPLPVPPEDAMPAAAMRSMASVELFIERALQADANFHIDDQALTIAARICRRVDGLPLAIEMVASWAGPLGLEALDAKLGGSLQAWLRARSTAPARHSTLHATLEWSHGLLSAAEQTVLRRLAVFAGSFTIRATEAVAGDDAIPRECVFEHLGNLVRKSMVAVVRGSGEQHYRLLETTRAIMFEKLEASGDARATRRRHANYVLSVLETASCELETTSDAVWLERYVQLLDDLRAALDWAMAEGSDEAVELAGASWPLWRQLSLSTEGGQRLCAAATRLNPDTPPAVEARLRRGLGDMLLNTAATWAAHQELERAVMLYRALGERAHLGSALAALGYALFVLDRIADAEQTNREAISLLEPAGWFRTLATAYTIRMCVEAVHGRFAAALAAGEKSMRLSEMTGADRTALNIAANMVQVVHLESGDAKGAVSAGRSVAARLRDTRHSDLLGFVLGVLAGALTALGELDEALAAAREAAPLLRDEGRLFWLFDHLALRAALGGRTKDAALISGYADAVYEKFGQTRQPMGRHAMDRTAALLCDSLQDGEIAELRRLGAQLSEAQATTIALGT
jgi:predicted ATPase/DNA-binding winged helix-turn-helix (wHTH) protein